MDILEKSEKLEIVRQWTNRFVSVAQIKTNLNNGVDCPCIWCGESTAWGYGRFVNRLPADRHDDDTGEYVDGYSCAECSTPPLCIDCDDEPPMDVHMFRCEACQDIAEKEAGIL